MKKAPIKQNVEERKEENMEEHKEENKEKDMIVADAKKEVAIRKHFDNVLKRTDPDPRTYMRVLNKRTGEFNRMENYRVNTHSLTLQEYIKRLQALYCDERHLPKVVMELVLEYYLPLGAYDEAVALHKDRMAEILSVERQVNNTHITLRFYL